MLESTSFVHFVITVCFVNSDDAINPDRMFDLVAVVIHIGSSINRGHYVSIVKSEDIWILFDDDIVDKIEASAIGDIYGLTSDIQKNSERGYTLFYQSREWYKNATCCKLVLLYWIPDGVKVMVPPIYSHDQHRPDGGVVLNIFGVYSLLERPYCCSSANVSFVDL